MSLLNIYVEKRKTFQTKQENLRGLIEKTKTEILTLSDYFLVECYKIDGAHVGVPLIESMHIGRKPPLNKSDSTRIEIHFIDDHLKVTSYKHGRQSEKILGHFSFIGPLSDLLISTFEENKGV